ncbi:MAG: YdcF family protein [Candidatus Saccharibacteria bacterium]|nr:YdcF family protein [Candidatus Saccharibacteria bacterium]
MNAGVIESAKIVWDYHKLHHDLKKVDLILVLGSHDRRVAEYASDLFLEGYAPWILFSGNEGVGKEVSGFDGRPEADVFAEIAKQKGVPSKAILVENKASNTGENIKLSYELVKSHGIKINSLIAAQKPYMQRRAFATLKAQWPNPQPEFIVTSQNISFEDYLSDPAHDADFAINIMVGDLQRIKEYPKLGYQIEQEISDEVWQAYEKLVEAGYDKHLL